jgi:hypothetical protein
MGFVFLDTSAFIKLYLIEKGSTWIRNFITNNQVIISELTLAESTNTLIRLFRDGILSGTDISNILATINIHNAKYVNIPLEIKNQLGMLALSNEFEIPCPDWAAKTPGPIRFWEDVMEAWGDEFLEETN